VFNLANILLYDTISDLVGLRLAKGSAELCEAGEAAQEPVRLLLLIRNYTLNQEPKIISV
jgi:hypothetical protein